MLNHVTKLLLFTFCINLLFIPRVSAYDLLDGGSCLEVESISNHMQECCGLCIDHEHSGDDYHFCGSCCHGHHHAFLSNGSFTLGFMQTILESQEEMATISALPNHLKRPPKADLI